MESKVVLVTGSSSGIGRAIAVHLANIGYKKLVLVARRENRLEEAVRQCRSLGATESIYLTKDLMKPEQCREVIDETVKRMGALHVLIGNAGSGRLGTVREMTLEDFQFNLDINLVPNFVLTKHALPHLEKTRGNIVYISSVSGEGVMTKTAAYGASKAALNHFAKMVAFEEASRGVRVNVVSPGCVMVDRHMAMFGQNENSEEGKDLVREKLRGWSPLGRIGEPEDMARLVAFIVSEDNAFMTGSNVTSDGGLLLAGIESIK